MIEKEIRGGICQAAHRYVKANNKYMNNYDKKIDSSYIIYRIFRCKQFVWKSNVSKNTCKWF